MGSGGEFDGGNRSSKCGNYRPLASVGLISYCYIVGRSIDVVFATELEMRN